MWVEWRVAPMAVRSAGQKVCQKVVHLAHRWGRSLDKLVDAWWAAKMVLRWVGQRVG